MDDDNRITEKDRQDYKEGQRDAKKSVPEQAINDIPANHPGTGPYYKGRAGEPLDADKNDEKKAS